MVGVFGVGFAEESAADADEVGAFFDGDLEVAGHAHGEDGEVVSADALFADVVEDPGGAREDGAGVLGLLGVGGHSHDPAEAQVHHGVDLLGDVDGCGGGDALFGDLAGDVDLQEDVDDLIGAGAVSVELFGESEGIDAVDEIDEGDDLFDFVALEVADHVPADAVGDDGGFALDGSAQGSSAGEVFVELGSALDELLDAVFAEVGVTEIDKGADLIGGGVLGDGNGEDVLGASADAAGGVGDALHDLRVGLSDIGGADHGFG